MSPTKRRELEDEFPNLVGSVYDIASPEDRSYNCIAWAAGDDTKRWWPDFCGTAFWPAGVPRDETLESFVRAYETLGYEPCEDGEVEEGFEKVAIYGDRSGPRHAARQLRNGRWSSKLGRDVDIEHGIEGLAGTFYGRVVRFLRRPGTST